MIIAAALAVGVAVVTTLVLLADDGAKRGDGPYVVLTYEVEPADGQSATQAREVAIRGIRERIDERGVPWASVTAAGPTRVRVELGGEDVPFDRVIELVERRATLGVHRVDHANPGMEQMVSQARIDLPAGIGVRADTWTGPDGSSHGEDYLWAEDRAALEAWLVSRAPLLQPADDRRIVLERVGMPGATPPVHWRTYVIEEAPIVDGSDVVKATVQYDPSTMRPQVELELDTDGRDRFAAATAAGVARKLAIVLDGRVMSAPLVQSPVPGGRIAVTMGGGDPQAQEREAHDLVAVLRVGSIPPLRLVERRDVGPAR